MYVIYGRVQTRINVIYCCFIFRKRGIQVDSKLCSQGPREYADIASRTSAVFIDKCDDHELLN